MTTIRRAAAMWIALGCLLLAATTTAAAETLTVTVANVLDGDTLDVGPGLPHLRLFGLDAPEISHNSKELSQPYGVEAKAKLTELAAGKVLRCYVESVDRYGRDVVVCRDGTFDINRAMVASGMAMAYRTYSLRYEAEEQAAACAGLGMWATTPLPPWYWRHCQAAKR